jgi:hypothetical protein
MKVRDHTKKASEYQGQPTKAANSFCPCRPCYHPHDWKTPVPVYKGGVHVTNNYPPDMRCCTRENHGCPQPIPEPEHIFSAKGTVCMRCKAEFRPRPTKLDEMLEQQQMRGGSNQ